MLKTRNAAAGNAVFKPAQSVIESTPAALPVFTVALGSTAGAITDDLGAASQSLTLVGIGNTILGGDGTVRIHGGKGLSTVFLGNGNDQVHLNGGLNTVVLGDGNDTVNVGIGQATVRIGGNEVRLIYGPFLHATLGLSLLPLGGAGWVGGGNIGAFNGGAGNIGVFNGLGNSDPSDGNNNIGAFNGNGNGGADNGNNNIGAFNGNLNGLGNSDPSDGNGNGNGNLGVLDGNLNGNLNTGIDLGNNNGNGNAGVANGNANGNGVTAMQPQSPQFWSSTLVGGFDTVVVGNGNDTITALAGVSTIVAGYGQDRITIAGSYNTVLAGNGGDTVIGLSADHTTVSLGSGGDTVTLSGSGYNQVQTGGGDDLIGVSGWNNWIDAGVAINANTIFGGAGGDTFVLHAPGEGLDKIHNFTLGNADRLDLRQALAATTWDGQVSDLGHYLSTTVSGAGATSLDLSATADGSAKAIANLVHTSVTLADLMQHSLIT